MDTETGSGGILVHTVKDEDHPYNLVNRTPYHDKRLLWSSRGVMAYLFTKPPGWKLITEDLIANGPSGEDAILSILTDLERFGYLWRSKVRKADGRWDWVRLLYEVPVDKQQHEKRLIEVLKTKATPEDLERILAHLHREQPNPDDPDLVIPDLDAPDLDAPDLAQPDLAQPDLAQPDLAQPDLAQPDLENPGMVAEPPFSREAKAAESQTMTGESPKNGSEKTGVASPYTDSPGLDDPGLAGPDLGQPDLVNPGAYSILDGEDDRDRSSSGGRVDVSDVVDPEDDQKGSDQEKEKGSNGAELPSEWNGFLTAWNQLSKHPVGFQPGWTFEKWLIKWHKEGRTAQEAIDLLRETIKGHPDIGSPAYLDKVFATKDKEASERARLDAQPTAPSGSAPGPRPSSGQADIDKTQEWLDEMKEAREGVAKVRDQVDTGAMLEMVASGRSKEEIEEALGQLREGQEVRTEPRKGSEHLFLSEEEEQEQQELADRVRQMGKEERLQQLKERVQQHESEEAEKSEVEELDLDSVDVSDLDGDDPPF